MGRENHLMLNQPQENVTVNHWYHRTLYWNQRTRKLMNQWRQHWFLDSRVMKLSWVMSWREGMIDEVRATHLTPFIFTNTSFILPFVSPPSLSSVVWEWEQWCSLSLPFSLHSHSSLVECYLPRWHLTWQKQSISGLSVTQTGEVPWEYKRKKER